MSGAISHLIWLSFLAFSLLPTSAKSEEFQVKGIILSEDGQPANQGGLIQVIVRGENGCNSQYVSPETVQSGEFQFPEPCIHNLKKRAFTSGLKLGFSGFIESDFSMTFRVKKTGASGTEDGGFYRAAEIKTYNDSIISGITLVVFKFILSEKFQIKASKGVNQTMGPEEERPNAKVPENGIKFYESYKIDENGNEIEGSRKKFNDSH